MGYDCDGCEKTGYMTEENIKKNIWTSGRVRDMEKKN
jgi:hypothetical protein